MLDKQLQQELIAKGRAFTRGSRADDPYEEDFESDQQLRLPQPPLCKAALTPAESHIPLTRDFSALPMRNDLVSLIRDRRSARVYTQEPMSLDQLSFLLCLFDRTAVGSRCFAQNICSQLLRLLFGRIDNHTSLLQRIFANLICSFFY